MKKNTGFEKFIDPKSNAKKKEEFRQEKRKAKAELRSYGEELRKEKTQKDRGDKYYKDTTENNKKHFRKKFNEDLHEKRDDDFYAKRNKKKFKEEDLANRLDRPKSKERRPSKQDRVPFAEQKAFKSKEKRIYKKEEKALTHSVELMPLNKFIAHSGVCGRREAAILVKQGLIKVNNDIVYEPGYKVSSHDKVLFKDKVLTLQEKLVYILMNKPKDHITTMEDEKGRKTVNDLVKNIVEERIYPVGRLDRNTTGVLLLTNDGDLAQKLMHPSFEVKKIYEVTLDKSLSKTDAEKILAGIELDDGFIKADSLGYADAKDKKIIGIEIHSGKNHIVKRIFMHLGYSVTKLDRVMFANLTKKNVERGKWRFLNEREIRSLKSLNQGGRFAGKKFMK